MKGYHVLRIRLSNKWFQNLVKVVEAISLPAYIASSLEKDLISWNFNRYNEEIAVRMLFSTQEGKKKADEIAKQLKEEGEIEDFYWLDDLWREPEFTVVAHEIATKCALKFKELLEYNTEIRKIVGGEFEFYRLLSFFYNLTSSLLANLHFDSNIIWEYERHSPIRFEEVKGMTSQWVSEEDREIVKRLNKPDIPSFLERFIHTFFNCLGLQWILVKVNEEIRHTYYLEGEVIRRILDSQLWFELGSTLG